MTPVLAHVGRWVRRLTAAALAGVLAGVLLATAPAWAHNSLVSTEPSDQDRLRRTPASVVLTFDEPAIAMGTRIVVTGPGGRADAGPPRLVDNTVTQDLRPGAPAGVYLVNWRVTSADGHPVTGEFSFTSERAGAGTPAPSSTPQAPTRAPVNAEAPLLIIGGIAALAAVVALVARRIRRAGTRHRN